MGKSKDQKQCEQIDRTIVAHPKKYLTKLILQIIDIFDQKFFRQKYSFKFYYNS